jgi:hypothetical protein
MDSGPLGMLLEVVREIFRRLGSGWKIYCTNYTV